ncbi:MAG: T9SS type A sorting domain-containing protein [Bacteroidia bacterium]
MKNKPCLFRYFLTCVLYFTLNNLSAQSIFPPGYKSYATALHIHGLSNHNGSAQPASMQWHSFYADTTNTPVLWWTDHRGVFTQIETCKFSFKDGVYNAAALTITGLKGSTTTPVKWVGKKSSGCAVSVSLNDSSVLMALTTDTTTAPVRYFSFAPKGSSGALKGFQNFVRPVTAQTKIDLDITPVGLNPLNVNSNVIQFIVLLSYHYYNGTPQQQSIVYNFVDNTLPFKRSYIDSATLRVNVPVINNVINHVTLNLTADAAYLRDGIDNAIQDYKLMIKSSTGNFTSARYSNITVYSTDNSANSQYKVFKSLANNYGINTGVREYTGVEWSTHQGQHMNGFLPDSASNKSILYNDNTVGLGPAYFVDNVHLRGGVASYNHPFGASGNLQSAATQDYRTDTLAQNLLANNAYGADIIEVGYLNRGGCDLAHHLKLWDILTANGLFLYGDGVTDSHGGSWYNTGATNNSFVTWIWSQDKATINLIASLKKGKSFFGSNIDYNSNEFYFKIDTAGMGDRLPAKSSEAFIQTQMTNPPAGVQYLLTQGLLQPGMNVNYLYQDFVYDPASPPCISLVDPCFVRVAVYHNGLPLLFSNPIVFTTGAPAGSPSLCIPAKDIKEVTGNKENGYKIYPNPATGAVELKTRCESSSVLKISVLNDANQFVKCLGTFETVAGDSKFSLNLSGLKSGSYFILIENGIDKNMLPLVISN